MFIDFVEEGLSGLLVRRGTRLLTNVAICAALSGSILTVLGTPSIAAGETRTISLYHTNTKESLTVTYMVNGRYVPIAMKQLNFLLRDWRSNQVISIDPKVIDLVWELHEDSGSKEPINIVCGYRSVATNGFLRRFSRGVAKKSQHILGKAIDINFPDVPTKKIRNIALVRQLGGVGYYPTSGVRGFVHVDSGKVRQWGPAISGIEMAQIFSDGRKLLASRQVQGDNFAVASIGGVTKPIDVTQASDEVDASDEKDLGKLSEIASNAPIASAHKSIPNGTKIIALDVVIPKPRLRPKAKSVAVAENLIIQPTSSPPPSLTQKSRTVDIAVGSNDGKFSKMALGKNKGSLSDGEGKFVELLRKNSGQNIPLLKPIIASAGGSNFNSLPEFLSNTQVALLGNVPPALVSMVEQSQLTSSPKLGALEHDPGEAQTPAGGKGDLLVVNREGKGDLLGTSPN